MSNKSEFDLAIAYRICPTLSNSEQVIPNISKLELAEICLKSFKESLGSLKVRMFVILDNCPQEYFDLFEKYFEGEDLYLFPTTGIGNLSTFEFQVRFLLGQKDSDLVYFAEDDYFYLPNQFEQMISFLKDNSDVDFITPYDHLDYYTHNLHKHKNYIRVFGKRHWMAVNSTCLTFLTTKTILQKNRTVFLSYSMNQVEDAGMWLSLTKKWLFNPLAILKFLFRDPVIDKYILKSWIHNWRHIIFKKRRKIWCPIPSIATHMVKDLLAPIIDWENIIKNEYKNI